MTYVTRRQRAENRKKKLKRAAIAIVAVAIIFLALFGFVSWRLTENHGKATSGLNIPIFSGQPYAVINNNVPYFDEEDKQTKTFESYSDLDPLGRCGVAYANVSRELMPTEERGEIGNIKPSGWNQEKYEGVVDSVPPYLYNRCHLIAYCLTAENANEKNLITGTRYMNVNGMLPFEEKVAKYLDTYDNHVLYRVTPIFEGNNLVASGVLMEAYSVEDEGKGICFCVYCYNVQPGVKINYKTGESELEK
jgi:DNA-entry nuclease